MGVVSPEKGATPEVGVYLRGRGTRQTPRARKVGTQKGGPRRKRVGTTGDEEGGRRLRTELQVDEDLGRAERTGREHGRGPKVPDVVRSVTAGGGPGYGERDQVVDRVDSSPLP